MKLTEDYFFPVVTDAGAEELYCYVKSILYKAGSRLPIQQHEDIIQAMVLRCLENLHKFDSSKGIPLAGFLYWQCRGAISIWANHHKREIACSDVAICYLSYRQRKIV